MANADPDSGAYDVLVVGAGAAGLFCAMHAGRGGLRVLLLDHAPRAGKKILISGGGRCNFTNTGTTPAHFLSNNPHFAKSALARYTPMDFLELVERHHIAWHEKTPGQLFCDRSAQAIVTMLEQECAAAQVETLLSTSVQAVHRQQGEASFRLETNRGTFVAPSLVIATGGLSIPKMGATDFGYEVAKQFGLNVLPCRPALVPLTFGPQDLKQFVSLAGISTEVIASTGSGRDSARFREKLLFTHRGMSGPAILQISSYWRPGKPLVLDLAPDREWTSPVRAQMNQRDLAAARNAIYSVLPQRLGDRWLALYPPRAYTNQALEAADLAMHEWTISPSGTEGYEKAEVTAGGVDTDDLHARSMESRNVAGLYFIGEVVDVTGHLGGFNFQWAWASGAAAGRALAGA